MKLTIRFKGGPGSGYHGHSGRKGKRGGSAPGGGGSLTTGRRTGTIPTTSAETEEQLSNAGYSFSKASGGYVKRGNGRRVVATARDDDLAAKFYEGESLVESIVTDVDTLVEYGDSFISTGEAGPP